MVELEPQAVTEERDLGARIFLESEALRESLEDYFRGFISHTEIALRIGELKKQAKAGAKSLSLKPKRKIYDPFQHKWVEVPRKKESA